MKERVPRDGNAGGSWILSYRTGGGGAGGHWGEGEHGWERERGKNSGKMVTSMTAEAAEIS